VIRQRIAPILRPQRNLIVGAAAAMVGATVVSLAAPLLTKVAIDRGIRRHDLHVIDVIALIYVCLVLLRPALERVVVLCSARAGERFLGDLRVTAYEKLHELSMPFFEQTRAGVLVSRLTNDVQTLTTFTRLVLVDVVGSLLLFVVTLVILV
jgi:ABC-type multidrug transport system fused ATPase/permease subunit